MAISLLRKMIDVYDQPRTGMKNNFMPFRQRGLMSTLFVLVGLLFFCAVVNAQTTGKISGKIVDKDTKESMVGANVVIAGTSLGASTDLDGNFFIINIPPGSYSVQASMIGYKKVTETEVIVNVGKTTTLSFELPSSAVMGTDVIVEAVRPDIEREKTSTSAISRPDEIQQLAGMHSATDVLSLSADVEDGHFRGGRSGEVLYTLQGMGTVNPYDGTNATDPIMSAVEEVEVVTSGFGAQYGNAQSGVVNISMKEGKAEKWHTYTELRGSVPTLKHFGSSPWDVSANPYLKEMLNTNNWDLSVGDGSMSAYAGLTNTNNGYMRLLNDTVMLGQVSAALNKQLFNNANRSYGNKPDYSFELSTGGPLSESTRMFIAGNRSISWPMLATEDPDETNQLLGNIVTDVGNGGTFRLSGTYSQSNQNLMSSTASTTINNSNDYLNFLYNMLTGTTYQRKTSGQLGLRFTKTLNQSTFYEIKLNTLLTRRQIGSRNILPDSVNAGVGQNIYWFARPYTSLIQYAEIPAGRFNDDKTQTVSLDASINSQVNKDHYVSGGIQANMYFIDVNDAAGGTFVNPWSNFTIYYAKPVEASIYIQDKMEFEGMIANVGLRLDGWYMNGTYANFDTMDVRNSPKYDAPILARLQPRVGFSFPISVNTVFHVNYGAFVQRPSFQYTTFDQKNNDGSINYSPNPDLLPQTTNSYDLGISQALGEGFTVDISGYYKNVNDLIRQVQYTYKSLTYNSYVNYDYADIRGFRIALVKRKGSFTGSVNYTYSVNTGSSASPNATLLTNTIVNNGGVLTYGDNTLNMPTQETLLDYDRTHNLVVDLSYATDENFGFKVGNAYPLGDISIALNSSATSGRPYTYKGLGNGGDVWMNMRSPAEYNTDVKLSKRIKDFYGTSLTIYAEVFNVFNDMVWNYNYLFSSSFTADKSTIIAKYLDSGTYGNNSGTTNGLLYYSTANNANVAGLGVDQSFLLYSNQPRSYWFGVSVEF